jgi:hypothetical protein
MRGKRRQYHEARSGFVPFDTFQSSKLALSWNFGTAKVGQLSIQPTLSR